MARNTGYQQAVYAAKTDPATGRPLDKNGWLCSISGNKQAIMLLEKKQNPDPARYEVVGWFKETEEVYGHPTMVFNTAACPLPTSGFIRLSVTSLKFTDSVKTAKVTVSSSGDWTLQSAPSSVTVNKTSGIEGDTELTFTSKGVSGADNLVFTNDTNESATLSIKVTIVGFPTIYPQPSTDKVFGVDYPVVHIGEQIWIRKNLDATSLSQGGFDISQSWLDANLATFDPVFTATAAEARSTFGVYYPRTYKNWLLTSISDFYNNAPMNIYQHQIPLADDYRELLAFVDNDFTSLYIKEKKSTPADPNDGIRFFYPAGWDSHQCLYGKDSYALSLVGSGKFQPKAGVSPSLCSFFNNISLVVRDIDPENTNNTHAVEGNVGRLTVKMNTDGSFWGRAARTTRYVDLSYEIYVNHAQKSFIELPKSQTSIPSGYTVLPRGAMRGSYFHNKVFDKGWDYDTIVARSSLIS